MHAENTKRKRSRAARDAEAVALVQRFDTLPDDMHIRSKHVALLKQHSQATLWRHVKLGLFPAGDKRGGIVSWRVGTVRAAMRGDREAA